MQHRIDMKRVLVGLIIGSSTLFGFDYKLEPIKVSDSVWCFLGKLEPPTKANGGFMSNSCYVRNKQSYLVIDTGPTYQFAKQSYEAMSKIAKLPVKVVINTHKHDDHWQGNNYFKEQFGSKLIGTLLQQNSFKAGDTTRVKRVVSPETYAGTKIVPLDQTITKDINFTVDGTVVEITALGYKAHTPSDLFVYLPQNKALFAGDLVMNGRISSNRDGSVLGQVKAHNLIATKDYTNLIAGHGFDTSSKAMDESKLYFSLIKQRVSKAIEDEIEADDITKKVTLPEFKDKAMYDELNRRNIFDSYAELEFAE